MLSNVWRWIFNRPPKKEDWSLSTPLLHFSRRDPWTIGHAVEGALVLGATGSGKTSGSGAAIANSFLRAGFGGLVLVVKNDERQLWERYCRDTGRLGDLIIFDPDQPHRFNFIDYEVQRKGSGAGLTDNIVNLFSTVLEIAERGSSGGGGGREEEGFWKRAMRQLCRNLVDILKLAKGSVSVPELHRLLLSAPTSLEQVRSAEWRNNAMCARYLVEADKRLKSPRESADLEVVADYFLLEYPVLSDKTRSVIVSTFTSMIDVLNRGLMRDLFCTETNLTPDAVESGKIILIDMPVKEFGDVGQFAQVLWKTAFQRSIERRNVADNPRPVFFWADEAQYFTTSGDMLFQTTCRASRVATVLLSQNVSNFYAALGVGQKGKVEADSLFANLNTKFFHANGDPVTNEWASTLIGRTHQFMMNVNASQPPGQWSGPLTSFLPEHPQSSAGMSEQIHFEVEPHAFTALRTGSAANGRLVDAVVFQNGRRFRGSGRTWLPVMFQQ